MIKPQTLKGFRDFLPEEATKRQYVIDIIRKTFELYGFEPLETPALEYEEILLGKYGEEGDKLMYRFEDNGKRKVALRYDQTVPLARVVAQYQNELPIQFKRYQIQPVWRAENTQKGRYREFLQCDIDTVGSSSPLADAEVILVAAKSLEQLGFTKYHILINDREIFGEIIEKGFIKDNELPTVLRSIDKIKKIGEEGVRKELENKGFTSEKVKAILNNAKTLKENSRLLNIYKFLELFGLGKNKIIFYPTLARGLDYYTSTIFEIEIDGYSAGSVCGGGRYDNLVGIFTGSQIPAIGFAFGFDRLVEAIEELKLFPKKLGVSSAKILITIFEEKLLKNSITLLNNLRKNNINAEIFLDPSAKLDKQLKYADKKGIPYVAIIGPAEAKENKVTVKNLAEKTQSTVSADELTALLQKST